MSDEENLVYKTDMIFISASDRWIYREFSKCGRLIGVNFMQGYDAREDLEWCFNDKKMFLIILAIAKNEQGWLSVSIEALDNLMWKYFEVMEAIENTEFNYYGLVTNRVV